MPRSLGIILVAGALTACSTLIPESEDTARRAGRTAPVPPAPMSRPTPQTAPAAPSCEAQLRSLGTSFSPTPPRDDGPGCSTHGSVQLESLRGDTGNFDLAGLGPLQCSTAMAFGQWARYGVDRAARQILGSGLTRIETMGSYACRNVGGSDRRSAHATAAAIDVSGFVLEDGRRIVINEAWDNGPAAEREFLRVIFRSACKRFGVVLGPRYNRAHEDHFHLETSTRSFSE